MSEKVTINMRISVHPIKAALYKYGMNKKISSKTSLRQMAVIIGYKGASPQQIKFHLQEMVKMGTIDYIGGQYVWPSAAEARKLIPIAGRKQNR